MSTAPSRTYQRALSSGADLGELVGRVARSARKSAVSVAQITLAPGRGSGLIVERLSLAAGLIALALGSVGPFALFAAAALFTVFAIIHWRNRYESAGPRPLRAPP